MGLKIDTLSYRKVSMDLAVIGVNANVETTQDGDRFQVAANYLDALTSVGALPIILPPLDTLHIAETLLSCVDGLLLIGGHDISTKRLKIPSSALTVPMHARREISDFLLIEAALKYNLPMLGICLGCQELAVALGGSICQDIATEQASCVAHRHVVGEPAHHMVKLDAHSKLSKILGKTSFEVNSYHHQAIESITSLLITAKADDGIIEAVELEGHPFCIGVQWHPERMHTPESGKLFGGLVQAALEFKKRLVDS